MSGLQLEPSKPWRGNLRLSSGCKTLTCYHRGKDPFWVHTYIAQQTTGGNPDGRRNEQCITSTIPSGTYRQAATSIVP